MDYFSQEGKNLSTLLESVGSLFTEDDIANRTKYAKELKLLGTLSTIVGATDFIETLRNWNATSKTATQITVYAQMNDRAAYMYDAVVDSELMFKEMYSSYTGTVITDDANAFEILS